MADAKEKIKKGGKKPPNTDLELSQLHWRYESLKTERSGWLSDWTKLSDLFLPARFRADFDTTGHKRPKKSRVVNSTGVLAMRTLASGMQGGMTSPVRPWFRLTMGDEQSKSSSTGKWLDLVGETMREVLHRSNFYNAVHSLYSDLGTFGTGLLMEWADSEGIHFETVRCGEYVLDVNGNNEVDTFFRRISMTARQIRDKFPDTCPDSVLNYAHDNTGQNLRFDVIHAVFPRTDVKKGMKIGGLDKPFVSIYYMMGSLGVSSDLSIPKILRVGGYDMFPAFAPRWDVNGTDVYGRSPAMDVEMDTIRLQKMTETFLKMTHKIADPPLVADRSIEAFGVDITPGALNFADLNRFGTATPIIPIQQPESAALKACAEEIHNLENTVYQGLYGDLFRMLIDDNRRQITATEIQAKQQEKMILIGPVVERLHKELLEPLIKRTYYLMQEWGVLPEAPEGLQGMIDVEFESSLAQAQKLTATSVIDQAVAFAMTCSQGIPDIIDNINTDEMFRMYLDRLGTPQSMIRSEKEVAGIRQKRQEQMEQQQQAMQLQQMAQTGQDASAAIKNLGQTPAGADGQTLMQTILGGMG